MAVVGSSGLGAGDAHAEFDALAELAAQCGDDRLAQVPFDLVLHELRRHRQQGKALGDDQRFDQLQPGPLLRGEIGGGGSPLTGSPDVRRRR